MSTKADAGKIPTNSSTITLRFPFTTAAGVQLAAVDTRRLKVKDLRRISKQSGGDEGEIETLGVAAMCGIVPEDLDDMDAADYKVVKDRFLEYVGVRQQSAVGAPAAGEVVPAAAE